MVKARSYQLRLASFLAGLVFLSGMMTLLPAPHRAAQAVEGGPSAFCHDTDGQFTVCPLGDEEWSDIPFSFFPESNSYLYADQADLDPFLQSVNPVTGEVSDLDTFVLMYDECGRTTPLGPDEYFLINFDTVEVDFGLEFLERYIEHVFADGTIIFIEDGELQTNFEGDFRLEEIDGQRGDVGFGPSPNCPFDHVVVEFQIVLDTAGGDSYSPDPSFWGATPPEPPACEDGEIKLQTKVNVLKGVSVSSAEIERVVSGLNDNINQAGTCLDFDVTKNIKTEVSDQGDDDGDLDASEVRPLLRDCVRELRGNFGGGKGYKIIFTTEILGDPNKSGASPHNPSTPCSFVKAGRTTTETAQTAAHEFAHAFTLGAGHLIDDKDTPDPSDDELADSLGHSSDPDNLMFGTAVGRGTTLTDDQIAELKKGAKRRSSNTEHASWVDDVGEVGLDFIDLSTGALFAEDTASDLLVTVNVDGFFPNTEVDVLFELLFDADNELSTGGSFGSFNGIDKILEISLVGQFPFTLPGGAWTARLVDLHRARPYPSRPERLRGPNS